MTGYERIAAALAGQKPDRVPVMLNNFMPAAREAGFTQAQYRWSVENIVETHLRAAEKYQLDGIVLDIDSATLAEALGARVSLPENEPARAVAGGLHMLADIHDRPVPNLPDCQRVDIWLSAADQLVERCGRDVYVRGHCDQAPFALAGMLRGTERWMVDLLTEGEEPHCEALLEYCTAACRRFVRLMTQTGVPMISSDDSAAGPGEIPADMYRRWAQPYERQVAAEAHGAGCQYVLNIRGRIDPILAGLLATKADGFELDCRTDPRVVRQVLGGKAALLGNIDPVGVMAQGSEAQVESAARALLEMFAEDPRFVLGAGFALPQDTPEANIRALVRTARAFG